MCERRRRHPVNDQTAGIAAQRSHVLHPPYDVAGPRRHDDRFARAAQHGRHLCEVIHFLGHVAGQAHRHDEVDVGEHLAQGRHTFDIGDAAATALAGGRVLDVQAVGARAVVDLTVPEQHDLVAPA